MEYRFSPENGASNDPNPSETDDQRARPRIGTLEEIADVAYGTLRKHDIEPPDDKSVPEK